MRKLTNFEKKTNEWITVHLSRISFIQKIFFVDHLRVMIHAGLSLVDSLEILHKETNNKGFQKIIGEIKKQVSEGNQFSNVLSKYPKVFPPIYVKMISAGEMSGKLENALSQVTIQMQKTQQLRSSIRGAMIYPAVVVSAMIGIGVLMTTVVLPKLITIFNEFDSELPLATKILIAVTQFISNPLNLILVIVILVFTITGFISLLKKSPSFKRLIHKINLHVPIFGGVIKKINLARFSMTLSSLMKSAIPIIEAVNITADTCSNILYQNSLHKASEEIKSGVPLSEILRRDDNIFPPMVTEMIMVGEQTGEIDNLLTELANFYSSEVDKTMKNFTTIIEPVLIIMLGIAVGGVAVAVIMPMYSLVQNF
ncbi:MAG: hypothetical protein COX81_03365 [Candidatus Magasanikbacteria bacterium CG_4_10_14_0_2_um_filter_37_12]|uniref:Type II secretion system protein GspF domain-containing protein n=1 Tax=Candidatus Magasanikbacteria bacterium CG_4_10_14_0_2_um_filter_37_12 TaxID=1974637 RepID=A0A2M7V731_9BACT|nr:MAG: hypothetical protein COX81_03365 [Candidatus Magasanikbacteria bacterium CG_4_10_14_0_2_um_filter_37_12]